MGSHWGYLCSLRSSPALYDDVCRVCSIDHPHSVIKNVSTVEYSIKAKSTEGCTVGVNIVGRAKMQGIDWNDNYKCDTVDWCVIIESTSRRHV